MTTKLTCAVCGRDMTTDNFRIKLGKPDGPESWIPRAKQNCYCGANADGFLVSEV